MKLDNLNILFNRLSFNTTPSSNVPYVYKNIYDTSYPGYGYCNSDLKNPYLSREQLNSRLVAPVINPVNYQNQFQPKN